MRSRAWHFLQWIAGLAIVLFVARYVAANWAEVRQAELRWRLSWPLVLASLGLVLAAFALLADAWRRTVAGWGYPLPWATAARVWLLSSMAKYVPGKVWALAGLAVMSERQGAPAWAAAGSAVLLQLLSLGTAAAIVALSGLAVGGVVPGPLALLVFAGAMVAISLLVVWPPLARRVVSRLAPATGVGRAPGLAPLVYGAAANFGAWLAYGGAFFVLARATLPFAPLEFDEALGAYTASYVAGVLAPFAPGGLGVREGILVLALEPRMGLANALALAAVSRLGVTAAETLASIGFLIRSPRSVRVESLRP